MTDFATQRMRSGRPVDATTMTAPLAIDLRRRTTDGYTRIEFTTYSDVHIASVSGEHRFTVYLTDEERRRLAECLLAGLEIPT